MPVSAHAAAALTWRQNESLVQMLNIQVSHSYFLRYDPKQWERGKPYPHWPRCRSLRCCANAGMR